MKETKISKITKPTRLKTQNNLIESKKEGKEKKNLKNSAANAAAGEK